MGALLTLLLVFADPQTQDVDVAAEAAVARLGAKRALDIVGETVNIRGLQAMGVTANIQGLEQAMRDLGAKVTAIGIQVDLPADVLFDFDKSDIRSDAAQALSKLAIIIRAQPKGPVHLEGHTDSIGDNAYNQKLSERRAGSVRNWLIEKEGIDLSRLITKGWGETRPVASNDTEANRQRNRRLQAVIKKQ